MSSPHRPTSPPLPAPPLRIAIVGRGRLGHALAHALAEARVTVFGPLGRGMTPPPCDVVLLCIPEPELRTAASVIVDGPLVGHCSASAPLDDLAPHARFVFHPLMTATASGAHFAGATCAIDGSSDQALSIAERLAVLLVMRAVRVPAEHRALYHAAAVLASGSLVALEGSAARVFHMVGMDRTALAPLAQASLDNVVAMGARAALTGPIARGDRLTSVRLRDALAMHAPDLVTLWDELVEITHRIVAMPADDPDSTERAAMRVFRSIGELRMALAPARPRRHRVGLVPTMGALHEGHLSLIRRARAECDVVVVSLFVNPAQFNDPQDLAAYPRTEAADAELAQSAGADILFVPSPEEVYPDGFATTVEVHGLTDTLEGAARGREHFRSVATVVAKLLGMTHPDVAYFGQKDAQQALVIRRLARDLDMHTRIEVCPIVREPDGLAMSSRNVRLSGAGRTKATALSEALFTITEAFARGERETIALETLGRHRLAARGIEPGHVDYVALVDAESLAPVRVVDRPTLVAIAAHVADVRLIDNVVIGATT